MRKFLYRIFCVVAMLASVYLIVDFLVSGTFDYRVFVMFLLLVVGFACLTAWRYLKKTNIMEVIRERGIRPDVAAGQSLGEYGALVAVGAMNFIDAAKAVRKRGIFMQEEVPAGEGGMAAILGMNADEIDAVIADMEDVQCANYNCPGQIVISGKTEQVALAAEKLKEAGARRAVILNVSGPFHSSLLTGAGEKLEKVLDELTIRKPEIPYVANVNASYITEQEDIKPLLVQQVSNSVRWQQSVETMVANGVDTFIEIGPGKTLAGFNKKIGKAIGKELTTYNVSTMEEIDALAAALAK